MLNTSTGVSENLSNSAIASSSLSSAATTSSLSGSTSSNSLDDARVSSLSASSSSSSSQGLTAQYYQGSNFNTLVQTKTDSTVNFNWGNGSPATGIGSDNFSVRWTGQIEPKYSETYTFSTTSDDGVRLWVNDKLLIDNWTPHTATENNATITLAAGQKYDIKLEYFEATGDAVCTLSWASPSQTKEIIPQSQLFASSNLYAASVGETAKTAYSFVDSIGVNTHLRYYDTSYGNFSLVEQRLQELGVRHIRDGGSDPTWIQRVNELGAKGIKSTIVIDPMIGVGPSSAYDTKPPGYTIHDLIKNQLSTSVDAVEILNEFDINYANGYSYNGQALTDSTWTTYVRNFAQDTYNSLKSDPATQNIAIIGPSFVYSDSTSKVGTMSQWVDYGNMHPYNNPSNPGDGNTQQDFANRSQAFTNRPMIATETGYFTGTTSNRTVSETVQGKYMPRMFLENFNQGIIRTFSYELMDQRSNSNNSEDNFGILHADGSPKPAFTAEKNLISLLNDSSNSFTPGTLNYSLGGNTQNVHHTLLQKSNKDFYLVLWVETPSTDQTITQNVTLNLSTPITQATTYLPNQSTTATGQYTSPTQLSLNVPDYPLVVKLTPA